MARHPHRRQLRRGRGGVVLVDVIIGVVLLAAALAAIVGIAGRAVASQMRGEQLQTAAMLLDERLNLVLMRGAEAYAGGAGLTGRCDPPFDSYSYVLTMSGGRSGDPYRVRATVSWVASGRAYSESAETLMAPRVGADPDPVRAPIRPVNRLR